jgi:hypothetical protein
MRLFPQLAYKSMFVPTREWLMPLIHRFWSVNDFPFFPSKANRSEFQSQSLSQQFTGSNQMFFVSCSFLFLGHWRQLFFYLKTSSRQIYSIVNLYVPLRRHFPISRRKALQGNRKRGRPRNSWRRSTLREAGRSRRKVRYFVADPDKWEKLLDDLCSCWNCRIYYYYYYYYHHHHHHHYQTQSQGY